MAVSCSADLSSTVNLPPTNVASLRGIRLTSSAQRSPRTCTHVQTNLGELGALCVLAVFKTRLGSEHPVIRINPLGMRLWMSLPGSSPVPLGGCLVDEVFQAARAAKARLTRQLFSSGEQHESREASNLKLGNQFW